MNLKLKYFSVEDAEAILADVTILIQDAQAIKRRIEGKIEEWRRDHKTMKESDEALLRGQIDFMAAELEGKLGQISELGGVPKDLDLGLVDFAARIEGKEGYLCWKLGELRIGYWHGLTEGFQGRKKLNRQG